MSTFVLKFHTHIHYDALVYIQEKERHSSVIFVIFIEKQCVGSGSAESVIFWLPQNLQIQGAKYQPNTTKKSSLSKPKSELSKKGDYKNFLISSSFSIKTGQTNLIFCSLKKIQ